MELIYWAEKSATPERNLSDIDGLAARLEVLKYDQGVAAHTGQLRASWSGLVLTEVLTIKLLPNMLVRRDLF